MARYKCSVCGYIFEETESKKFEDLKQCPVCKQPASVFERIEEETEAQAPEDIGEENSLDYPAEYVRRDPSCRYMAEIHRMAVTGKPIIEAMGTQMKMPCWDEILILGAQLNPPPLMEHEPVSTTTVIGKHAKKPMVLDMPVYISHMSFGAMSKEMKTALAKGSAMAKTAMCSGEGGILPEEKAAA